MGENCLPDVEAITDLPAYDNTFPNCITPTDSNLILYYMDPAQKSTILVELIVCHETNFDKAKSKQAQGSGRDRKEKWL